MENQIIVEIRADDLWSSRNQRPTEADTLHAQSRGKIQGSRPLFSA